MFRRVLLGLGVLLVALIAVLGINFLRYTPDALPESQAALVDVDVDKVARDMSASIGFKTIAPAAQNRAEFDAFLAWLAQTYPNAHGAMELTLINDLTPLYVWRGSGVQEPILLTAHYDVVDAVAENWDVPPWEGVIDDTFVWGRGTLDDKGSLITMMEAADMLAASGFAPNRDIYFSFGHDEETSGQMGANSVVAHLRDKGVRFDWTLDEGSMVLRDMIPGLSKDIISINVAEKGVVTLDLIASGAGGHSSLPPRETAVGALSRAVARLQEQPFPGGLTDISRDFFDALGPHMGTAERLVFSNQWLFKGILEGQLGGSVATDAMLRTTTAPTMLQGSSAPNVLPQTATATVNFRIHPRDSIEGIVEHVRQVIDDDSIQIVVREGALPASPVSSDSNDAFEQLSSSFLAVFHNSIIVPGLTIAATDSRFYGTIADDSYRIVPFIFTSDDLERLHGVNERVSLKNLERAVQFYHLLLSTAAQ